MSAVAGFVQVLSELDPAKIRRLHSDGVLDRLFVLVHPDYDPPVHNHQLDNRTAWHAFRQASGIPMWAWINAKADQQADVDRAKELEAELSPSGYLLDIEGTWTKGAKLDVLAEGVTALARPVIASLAGTTASHVSYDYEALDRWSIAIDWQAYLDSGEGPAPPLAVTELYQSSFVIPGWEYRHHVGGKYAWGKVTRTEADEVGLYDSYRVPAGPNYWFRVGPRLWGNTVDDRRLMRIDNNRVVGLLMGLARYPKIRVTLDVTRDAHANRTLAQWTALAASARAPGAAKRPISVYLLEVCPEDVLRAIAAGAG